GSSSTNRSTLPSNRSAKGSSGGGISDVGLPSPSDSSNREFAPEARALCWNLLDDFINWYRKGRVVIGGDTVAKQKQLRPIQEDPEASAAATAAAAAVGQQSEGVDLDGLEDESSDVVGPQLVRSQGSFKHQHPYQHQASSNSQQHRRTPSHRVCYYSPVRTPLLILLSFKIQRVLIKANIRELTLDLEVNSAHGMFSFRKTAKQKHRERWPFKLTKGRFVEAFKASEQVVCQLTVHKSHASLPYNRNLSVRGINEKSSLYIGLGRIEIRIPHHPVMLHDVVQRSSKIMTSELQEFMMPPQLAKAKASAPMSPADMSNSARLSSPPGGDRVDSAAPKQPGSSASGAAGAATGSSGAAAFAAAAAAAGGTAASSAAANPAAAAAASADRAELKEPPLRVKVKAQLAGLMIEAALNSSLCARYEIDPISLIGQVGPCTRFQMLVPAQSLQFSINSSSSGGLLNRDPDIPNSVRVAFPSCYLVTEHRPYELEDDIGKDDLTQGLKYVSGGFLDVQVSNRVQSEQEFVQQASNELFFKANLPLRLELNSPLSTLAFFYTQIRARNNMVTERTSGQNQKAFLFSVHRPHIYIEAEAVNKALVLLNYNYAKTWEKCENYFNALDREAAKTAARGYQHQHHLRPTSTAPVLANVSPPIRIRQAKDAPVPVQTDESSTVFLQLTVEDFGIALHTGSIACVDKVDSPTALVLTLESSRISAVYKNASFASEGSFANFCLRFEDDFNQSSEDWKPEVSTVSNFDRIVFNACAVPEGSFKICSSSKNSDTELAATLVKTMLDFHWQMHGLDIHLDINIGKRLKHLFYTLKKIMTGDDSQTGGDSGRPGDSSAATDRQTVVSQIDQRKVELEQLLADNTLDSRAIQLAGTKKMEIDNFEDILLKRTKKSLISKLRKRGRQHSVFNEASAGGLSGEVGPSAAGGVASVSRRSSDR
uniref:PH domain-containing protein n=1 Tax=Macrostomum lignano TaxID=282301 RepID=A0A1I8J055_9PLAT